jgi:type VI secretion system protein ImpM
MRCGLYGKLASKRDFIALSTPREFLAVWEPWIQGAVSASMLRLGAEWKPTFLMAPIWRFWLGSDLCGAAVIGAFMPSLDGIGRYFPLTVFALAGDRSAIPPPELEPHATWFLAAEEFLLSTLEHDATFDSISVGLEELKSPAIEQKSPSVGDGLSSDKGSIIVKAQDRDFSDLFKEARLHHPEAIYAGSTFWWTLGGEGFPAVALVNRRMPDPFVFTGMLTGRFEPRLD